MGKAGDKQYEPLLSAGMHVKSIQETQQICVSNFPEPKVRMKLFNHLVGIIEQFGKHKVGVEIWVDGSFLTKKPEPNDVDIVILLPKGTLANATEELRSLINSLAKRTHPSKGHCDTYVIPMLDMKDLGYIHYEFAYTIWFDRWSHDYDRKPKGFIAIQPISY